MSFGSGSSYQVKKFESQEEVEEKKRKRQEQWDKVRKPEDPEECPEEETRSLFEQLQANKEDKEKEYEDQFKMRNSVQGLEEEETKFLNFVSNRQVQLEREREKEESKVLEQMKEAAVKRVVEKSAAVPETKKSQPAVASSSSKKSQQSLLLGAIKRKSTDVQSDDSSKRRRSEGEQSAADSTSPSGDKLMKLIDPKVPVAQIAGVLPGIGSYNMSSDSETSSEESDIEDYMKTRRVIKIEVQQS